MVAGTIVPWETALTALRARGYHTGARGEQLGAAVDRFLVDQGYPAGHWRTNGPDTLLFHGAAAPAGEMLADLAGLGTSMPRSGVLADAPPLATTSTALTQRRVFVGGVAAGAGVAVLAGILFYAARKAT